VPTYNFGVVVDDIDMNMTHVIRGDDHVNNTPRQINLYRALGADMPHFGHVPMILGADGQRLSKRHGAVNVMQYKDDGYLPDAMVNYLARLGWSHGDDEVFSREQLVQWFDLEHVSRSPARWDPEKLKWMNGEYLRRLAPADIAARLRTEKPTLMAEVESRMDAGAMIATAIGDLQTFRDADQYLHEMSQPVAVDPSLKDKHLGDKGRDVLAKIRPLLADVKWDAPAISAALKALVQSQGLKMPEVMMPLRVAVTGRTMSPGLFELLAWLGPERTRARLNRLLEFLATRVQM
jgi:glutamyl-tRNA synthetase